MHLKTKNMNKSLDLRLIMHRFHKHVRLIQRVARRFTVIRHARMKLLELKWEKVELQLATEARDAYVQELLRERDQRRIEQLIEDNNGEDEEKYKEKPKEEKDRTQSKNAESEEYLGERGVFDHDYGDNHHGRSREMEVVVEKRRRTSSVASSSRHLSTSLDWKSTRNTAVGNTSADDAAASLSRTRKTTIGIRSSNDGMSPFVMKQLMEEQLSSALGQGPRRKSTQHEQNSLKRHVDFSTKTTAELGELMSKYLNQGNREMVLLILKAVDDSHDDLNTPSGGIAVSQFLNTVTGDVRKDSISAWLKRHMKKVRDRNGEIHSEDVRLWKLRGMHVDVNQTKQMLLNMLVSSSSMEAVKERSGGLSSSVDEKDQSSSWHQTREMLKKGTIDIGLEKVQEERPAYPTVLLLTGPLFDEVDFRKQIIKTLEIAHMG
jgi:hypothetical protein